MVRGGAKTPGWLAPALATLLAALPAPSRADAPPTDTAAQQHFVSGQAYYDRGEYAAASREFQQAYGLSHRPELLFNIYLAEERLGNFRSAAQNLEQYLARVPDAPNRELLEDRLTNLEQRAADEEEAARVADEARAAAAARAAEEARAAASRDAADRGHHVPVSALASWAVAGAGLVSFTVAGSLALRKDRELSSTCGSSCTDAQVEPLHRRNLAADLSLGVALAAGVTGVVLYFVQRDRDEPPHVSFFVSPTGAGVGYATRFAGGAR